MKVQNTVQNTLMESKSRRLFQSAKRVALSAPGVLLVAVAVMGGLMSITPSTGADDRNEHDGDESKIQQGFAIAPVPLDLRGKNRALVGKGSYIVNAQGDCNACHTTSANEYVPGGNPFLGEPEQIDQTRYLIGGRQFGPVGVGPRSRNLTPDPVTGLPAGYTFEQFLHVLRTGEDLKQLPPHVPSVDVDLLQAPMPWPLFQKMTDRDILAIYEYLRSVPSRPGFPQ
jgi:mono/diheme cytochrome c family protein